MKTLKHKETSEYLRIADNRAEDFIKTGHWKYCPKAEWKKSQQKDKFFAVDTI